MNQSWLSLEKASFLGTLCGEGLSNIGVGKAAKAAKPPFV